MRHKIWHHVAMVIALEIINIIWFAVGLIFLITGILIFNFRDFNFLRVVVGIPTMVVGVGVILIKLHEILLTVASPSWVRKKCRFCT